jgi:hypothetical protein
MNHLKIYELIIQKVKSENRIKSKQIYYENHHIIPRCMGGLNVKENLVLLTAREHFICHKLLVCIYPKNRKLVCALHKMIYGNTNKYVKTSRDYAYIRELISKIPFSKETLEKFHKRIPWNKNKKGLQHHTENSKKILSEKNTGENNAMYGKKGEKSPSFGLKRSVKVKQKLSEGKLGKNNPNAGKYEIHTPDNFYFIAEGATTFINEHPEYNINRHFIYSAASVNGNLYKGWRVKKLN